MADTSALRPMSGARKWGTVEARSTRDAATKANLGCCDKLSRGMMCRSCPRRKALSIDVSREARDSRLLARCLRRYDGVAVVESHGPG